MTVTIAEPDGAVSLEISGSAHDCWRYRRDGLPDVPVAAPTFELDGAAVTASFAPDRHTHEQLDNGVVEHRVAGPLTDRGDLTLTLVVRLAPGGSGDPIVRFRYELAGAARMTRTGSAERPDRLGYLAVPLTDTDVLTQVRLSEFDELAHTFRPSEQQVPRRGAEGSIEAGTAVMGPILAVQRDGHALVLAYEHGSQAPDAFAEFAFADDRVLLRAVHGTYLTDQPLPYRTLWCQLGGVAGGLDELAAAYRRFVLEHQSPHPASRQPWVFYNTWGLQERTKWWHGGNYLDPMHTERMLAEIDVAHRIGVDVFVLDTGWYVKTGDWHVNADRFGADLAAVRQRLSAYGMQLGLWFGPMDAAVSAQAVVQHPEFQVSWRGSRRPPRPVWETEDSVRMCVVSGYGDLLADRLIDVGRTLGVTYFKWDAIDQYGCDDPGHGHGGPDHSPDERAAHYAYRLPLRLAEIAERVCAALPEAIVDFDVTEHRRAVGLAFLAAGKYFLINNGPYHSSLDQPDVPGRNPNVFFYPGPARAQVARTPLDYDRWIPSTLFLTHYLPDDPAESALVNVASLMLGQNGFWGDLTEVSDDVVALLGDVVGRYKRVRADMTATAAVRTGAVGGSPEIHERVSPSTGRGAVVAFSPVAGSYDYVTAATGCEPAWCTDGASVEPTPGGHTRVRLHFDRPGAQIAIFGAG